MKCGRRVSGTAGGRQRRTELGRDELSVAYAPPGVTGINKQVSIDNSLNSWTPSWTLSCNGFLDSFFLIFGQYIVQSGHTRFLNKCAKKFIHSTTDELVYQKNRQLKTLVMPHSGKAFQNSFVKVAPKQTTGVWVFCDTVYDKPVVYGLACGGCQGSILGRVVLYGT